MEVIKYEELKWNFLEKENVEVGFIDKLIFNNRFDVIHARIKPNERLNKHFHNRPDNGEEIFCFFKGGHFKLLSEKEEREFNTKNVLFIHFNSKEIHGVQNLSNKALEFQVWCSPPFKPGEVKVL
ncbi:MAG: hypothetical protein V1663_03480 [archaeon]